MKGTIDDVPSKTCDRMFRNASYKASESDNRGIAGLSDGITDNLVCAMSRIDHIDTCRG